MRFQERQKTENHRDQQSVCPPSWIVVVVTSSFLYSIVFAVHTRKTVFSNSTVFKSFHSGERFRIDPFSLIVFGVVV